MFKRIIAGIIVVAFVVLLLSGCATSYKSAPWDFEETTNAPVYIEYNLK